MPPAEQHRERVLVAVGSGPEATRMLHAGRRVAALLEAEMDVVRVLDHPEPVVEVTEPAELRLIRGDPERALLGELAADDVVLLVIGARDYQHGPRPFGHVTRGVVAGASKPVLVVPPNDQSSPSFSHALIALEGDDASSMVVGKVLDRLSAAGIITTVVHVFNEATRPRFLDRPTRDLECLAQEFLDRHVASRTDRLRWRVGPVARRIADVAEDEGADFIVVSWKQHLDTGRATVLVDLLEQTNVPVLLVPIFGAPAFRRGLSR
jgi:hypothetical protein